MKLQSRDIPYFFPSRADVYFNRGKGEIVSAEGIQRTSEFYLDVEEIDRDDGVQVFIEKQAVRSMEQADIHEVVDVEDVYLDDAGDGVDEDYDEDGNHRAAIVNIAQFSRYSGHKSRNGIQRNDGKRAGDFAQSPDRSVYLGATRLG